MKFSSQRVAKPSEINTLPLLDSEFVKNKVWVDENYDEEVAVQDQFETLYETIVK